MGSKRRSVIALLACLGSSVMVPSSASALGTITVTPSTGLIHGESVLVEGAGFNGGALIGMCQAVDTDGTPGSDECGGPIMTLTASPTGSFSQTYTVRRAMYVPRLGRIVDCADPVEECHIGAAEAFNIAGTAVTTPISFAPQPPPDGSITVTPDEDLGHGHAVTVAGSGFFPDLPFDLAQCLAAVPDASGCERFVSPATDSSGQFSVGFSVAGNIGTTDCSLAPGTCEIRVSQASVVATAPLSFDFAASGFQPDGQIVRLIDGRVIGDDLYNLDGASQDRTRDIDPGARLFFALRVQNDSSHADDITVTGPGSSPGFTVRYFVGPFNVTPYVTGGGLTLGDIAPTARVSLAIDIGADTSVAAGSTKDALVTFTSGGDPDKADAVKVGVRVRTPT